ncbi:hypothetical protein PAMA_019368 [Pampus argenteus]
MAPADWLWRCQNLTRTHAHTCNNVFVHDAIIKETKGQEEEQGVKSGLLGLEGKHSKPAGLALSNTVFLLLPSLWEDGRGVCRHKGDAQGDAESNLDPHCCQLNSQTIATR